LADEPERTVAVEQELVGRRVTLRVERVVLQDGTETLRDIVQHPSSVVIVPLEDDGSVVMVRQYRKAAGRELLEFPAGVMEEDASPLEAARRELREETGLDATELIELGNFFAAPGSMTERLYSFLATGLFPNPLAPDEDERITLERMPFAEAVRLARAGELNDAKSLASLMLAAPHVID
jgi:ADP-ribose pyrophosphatase